MTHLACHNGGPAVELVLYGCFFGLRSWESKASSLKFFLSFYGAPNMKPP